MRKPIAFLLTTVFMIAACDDASGPSGDRLTRPEAMRIAGDLAANGNTAATASRPGTSGDATIASPPTTFTTDHTSSHPCPKGGRVQLTFKSTGAVDLSAAALVLDVAGKQTHQSCAFDHEGVTLTVTGDPSLDFDAHAALKGGQPSEPSTSSVKGQFKWSASDGRSGTCQVNLKAVTDFASKKHTLTGDVCGHTIQQVTTWR